MLNWDNSSTWTYPGCCYWTDSRENYFFENPQERSWLRTNTKLKKNAENSKTETRLCIVTPAHTVHSYEIVKDNKGGYYDGVAPWPAVPLFFQTAPPWWSLLLLHSNISFLLRTCSHILPSFFEGRWEKDFTYLHLPLGDISGKDSIYFIVLINNCTSKYYSPIWKATWYF